MLEARVMEMRWVIALEQKQGAFCEPLELADGRTAFARLQFRETGLAGGAEWQEIPIVSEIVEAPRIALVRPGAH